MKEQAQELYAIPSATDQVSRLNTIGFVGILVIAVLANLLFGAVNSGALGLIAILLALILIVWMADSLFSGKAKLSFSSLHIPIVGLILLGLVQLIPLPANTMYNSVYDTAFRTPFSMDPFATKLAIIRLTLFALFFSLVLIYFNSAKRLKIVVFLLVIFGSVMSFYGILQQLADEELVGLFREVQYAKPFGTYINRHHFAAFLEMTFALVLGLLFTGSTRPDNRVLLVLAAVLMGLGIVFTTSRGALISLVGILAFLSVLTFVSGKDLKGKEKGAIKSKAWALVAANVALIGFLIVSVAWIGGSDLALRATGMLGPKDVSNGRIEFWSNSLKIAADNPIIGSGLDSFGVAYTKYDQWNGTIRVDHAHNDYLQMLSDGGIVGLALVLLFIFLLFRKGLKTIAGSTNPMRRGIAAGALAGCFGVLVHSFFDFPLRTNANMFFFLICAALVVVEVPFQNPLPQQRKKSQAKP